MPKHLKRKKPSDADLDFNPLIGASKGTTRAGISPDDLAELKGANTLEGDVENDTTPQGGIEPPHRRRRSHARKAKSREEKVMQGKKTHEQMLRTLERKPDVPGPRQTEEAPEGARMRRAPKRNVRLSECPVSRGGMNQESRDHNKHNDPGQSGHKPQEPSPDQEKH